MFLPKIKNLSKFIKNFKKDQKGSVLIQVGLAATVLIGMLGIGVDLSRAYLFRAQLSGALDAAALAGAKSFHSETRDAEIQAFFSSNFDANFMGGTVQPLNIQEVDVAQKTLSVSTTGSVNTAFMQLFGWDTIDIGQSAETTSKQTGLQLVMVLDATGSMRTYDNGTQRMEALKTASKTLVNQLFGEDDNDDDNNDKLQIAVVPYVTTVNIGGLLPSEYVDMSSMPASYTYDANNLSKWNGCVEARHTNANLSAADSYDVKVEHDGEDWVPFLWRPHYDKKLYNLTDLEGPNGETWPAPDYQREGGNGESSYDAGPNINCPAPVLDFSSTQEDLTAYLDSLYYSYNRGGTIANLGLIWGWRMLHTGSPFFNPIAYDDPDMAKAIVLMTDGVNQIVNDAGVHPYYDGNDNDNGNDKNDDYDDDGDGKCPDCSGRRNDRWDPEDENNGPNAFNNSNGPNIGKYYTGDYSGYGRRDEGRLEGATSTNATRNAINKRVAYVCSAMKGMGITVYTITFGGDVSGNDDGAIDLRNLYQGCATDNGKYFHAPSSAELDGAFEAIANDLADLRLSK